MVAIASALLTEYLLGKVSREFTLRDGSALVTGLLVGMNMPPLAYHQFYIPLIASAFAITVVKWTFGGLGCNWMNPALAGRVFVFFSFTSQNNGFYEYFIDGVFSWSEMFKDLGQSFDFFGGGRYETNFVIDSCALEITHYMADWDLSVRYEAQIQLIGDNYQFVPELSIYLSWKTIPDIKIDQTWRERNGSWSMQ